MGRCMSLPLLAAGLGLIFHFGGQQVRRFERLAAEDLRTVLSGPAATVSVKTSFSSLVGGPLGEMETVTVAASDFICERLPLFTDPRLSRVGAIRELRLDLKNFRIAGLDVASLEASFPNCRFDYGLALHGHRFRLSRSGTGEGRVRILEDALGPYIVRKYKEVAVASVRIEKDKIFVDGTGEFLMVRTQFSVIAALEVGGGTKLVLAHPRVFFDGRRADPGLAAVLLRALNPVVDLDRDLGLFGAMRVAGLSLRDGVLEAWGPACVPVRPVE